MSDVPVESAVARDIPLLLHDIRGGAVPSRTVISGRIAVYSCRSVPECDRHITHLTRRLAVPADDHLRDDIWADLDALLEMRMRLTLAEEGTKS